MGPDEIPTRLLKELAKDLTPIFTLFYQKVSEYDKEIPHSHTADQPTAPRGRATEHL